MNKLVIAPTTEIVATLYMQAMKSDTRAKFQSDPRGSIREWMGSEIAQDVSLEVVENSAATINLTLPYYSDLDGNFPSPVAEADLDEASGGWYNQLQSYLRDNELTMKPIDRTKPLHYGDAFWATNKHGGGTIMEGEQWDNVIMKHQSPASRLAEK